MMGPGGLPPPPPPYPGYASPSAAAAAAAGTPPGASSPAAAGFRPHMASPVGAGGMIHPPPGGLMQPGGPMGIPPPGVGVGMGPGGGFSEMEERQRVRFQTELEFVQCLGNPNYLHFLAQRGYFKESTFINYLSYLQYWKVRLGNSLGFVRFYTLIFIVPGAPVRSLRQVPGLPALP